MRRFSFERSWLISVLLVALFVRALIPMGFMPAMDRPFSFQICPDGFPAHMLKRAMGVPASGFAGNGTPAIDHSAHPAHHHVAAADTSSAAEDAAFVHEHGHHAGHAAPDALGTSGDLPLSGEPSPASDPTHRHSAASAEHCAFAAAAGAPLMAFVPTFSALAAVLHTSPESYVQPAFEPQRFRVQQPRGPPALS
jgi:hypothetical protein